MKKLFSISAGLALVGLLAFAASAYAATPIFTLSQSGSSFTLSVSGGPGIASVYFYYYDANQNGSMTGQLVGTTNANGDLATPITFTTSTYNGVPGWPTYVMVGAEQSALQNWPGTQTTNSSSATSSGSISFDYPNVSINAGGGAVITAYGGSGYYISGNSNSGVATVSSNGSTISITAVAAGTSAITVCSASNGCGTVNVTVNQTNAATTTQTAAAVLTVTSTSSVLSVIQAIQSQLAQLLTQIQSMASTLNQLAANVGIQSISTPAISSAPAVPSVLGANTYNFTKSLKFGSEGTEVLELQKYLVAKGFLTAAPNSHFGPSTEAAVKAYQSAHGLEAVGYVGPATRADLNAGK